jgi:VWFA-related protein
VGATPAGSDGAPAQQPEPPIFAAAVDLILVDAIVTDGQGRIVTGLTADDFVVREDGEPQALTSFEAVDLAPVAPTARPSPRGPPRSSSNDAEAESRRRVFLVVMDDAGLGLPGAIAARKAAKQFLSEAKRPGDLVTIVVPGAGLTWSDRLPEGEARLLSIVDSVEGRRAAAPELAGDFEALQIVQGTDPLAQESARVRLDSAGQLSRAPRLFGESDQAFEQRNREFQQPALMADASRQLDRDRERRQRLFAGVTSALEAVASVKGRKSVLLF